MRKLAYPVTVSSSTPIPETDRLDITRMEGNAWQVVTERGSFKPGDRAIYFEIDSALPIDDSRYDFLKERCLRSWCDKHGRKLKQAIRIRTIKLRGVLSQGLLMPIGLFEEARWGKDGEDCTEILRVQHYDDIAEEMAAILDTRTAPGTGKRQGNFPAFVPKSDEERCVTADTLVTLSNNTSKRIKDVELATDVASYDVAKGTRTVQKVEDKSVSESMVWDEWFRLTTNTGHSVCITGNSRVWLPNLRCYRRVDQLMPGDKLLVED